VTVRPSLAGRRPAFALSIGIHNQVLFVLVIVAVAAVVLSGFVGEAANRLVSGRPVPLWAAAGTVPTAGIAVLGAALAAACLIRPSRALYCAVAMFAAALLLLVPAAAGEAAASLLAQGASPATRISLGPAFWVIGACAALAVGDALQRLRAGIIVQMVAVAGLASGLLLMAASGTFDALSLAREYEIHRQVFADAMARHMTLVGASVGAAAAIGFPLGVAVARRPGLQGPVFAVLNILQTIPSIALFGLLIVPLSALVAAVPRLATFGVGGIGVTPAIIALVLYALLPVVRNTSVGLTGVDSAAIEAGRGMGMRPGQIFREIELPLALPVLLAGLRIVTVQAIGLAVVAALIGAGGLGAFVFEGLGQYAVDLVLLGALPAIFLALGADFMLQILTAMLHRRFAG
jgi:osmoprotectant transport system permease protein